jgi:hypothetical protein
MRSAFNFLLVATVAMMASFAPASPVLASCGAWKPDGLRQWRRDLWQESSLVFVGKVLAEGETRTRIEDSGDPDNDLGTTVTVEVAVDRLEKGRSPAGRRITFRYDVGTPVEDIVGCRSGTVEAGERWRFYLTPSTETPGQYIGYFLRPEGPAR